MLNGLSLFANVGIAETYLTTIGVNIKLANELDIKRANLYKILHPQTEMICGDITSSIIRDKIVERAKAINIDFLIATPPCQGMSEAGLRLEFDERNQLIFYAIDVIKRVKPKFILLENVPKQLTTKINHHGNIMLIPDYIKSELEALYSFNQETLVKAKDHGIPQLRERNIMLLVRNDLNRIRWEFPKKEPEITLKDAIGHLPSLDPQLREGLEFTLSKFPKFELRKQEALKISKWHRPPIHSWRQVEWMMHTPTGKSAIYNEIYFPQKDNGVRIKAHHNNYRRLKWDMPCRTITQNNGVISSLACVHPGHKYVQGNMILYSDPRVLSLYELMIVSSLPSDWAIPENINESFIRRVIGEGIPPLLIKKILEVLLKQL